ncbi:peptidase M16 [Rubrivivax gelatinosus]|nr:peptidase M16 [Rubrivivax gelatinosus]
MIRAWFAAAALVLSAPLVQGAPPSKTAPTVLPSPVTSVEGITEYRLPNGLQILLVPDESKPTTTVNVTYRVGSRHESYGETGMAHLLEHLLFKGTPTTRNVMAEFSRRGMRANGTTWFDRTNYFASFSANDENLRWYLSWQADAMVNSLIARSDLDTEMTVVRNEMEMGENSPGGILLQKTMAVMYDWHAYGKDTIGARADVENVDIPRLQAFYRRYYQPDNATLIVSGRFDVKKTLAWVVQDFGKIPRPKRVIEPTYTLDPAQDGERSLTLRRSGGAPLVFAGYHVPPGAAADFAAASLVAGILGDAPAGRLHKRLVEGKLASSSFSAAFGLAEPGAVFLGVGLAPGQDVDKARSAMLATIDALATEPITAEELERARTQWLNAWEQGFTDPQAVGVELSDAIARGDWRLFFVDRDQIQKLTLDDVNRVARQYLQRDNRTVGTYLPTEQPQRAPTPARVDVAALVKDYRGRAQLAQAEAFEATPDNLDRRTQVSTLKSGLKIGLLSKSTRGGAVQARLRLHFGDGDSLKGQETVAAFAASLLDKGGAGLTRQQIADRFDALRAQVGFRANGQDLDVFVTTVREHLPATLALIGRLLREPAFPGDALDELKRQWLTAIENQRQEPEALVAKELQRHGNPYPRGDLRYAPSFDEIVEDVAAVDTAKIAAFHRRFYSAAAGEFSAIGDFDADAVKRALVVAFADWRAPAGGALPYVRLPQPLVEVAPAAFKLKTPDKQNANLRTALALPLSDRDADYPALLVANYLFGGGTSSRLWTRVRETEGLSYDVRSTIDWNRLEPNSTWSVSAIFAPQNRAKVEAAVMAELEKARRDGFTQAELDAGRKGLLNVLQLQRAQDGAVAGQLAQNLYLGRSFAFAQQVDEKIGAVTLEQVNAALRKYFDPSRWSIAWGGDF